MKIKKKYRLTAKLGDMLIYESDHYTRLGVWWKWFVFASIPSVNPLGRLQWSYYKLETS